MLQALTYNKRAYMAKQLCDSKYVRLEKQQKLNVQGYNLEVHNVIKLTRKQRKCFRATDVTNYITCKSGFL